VHPFSETSHKLAKGMRNTHKSDDTGPKISHFIWTQCCVLVKVNATFSEFKKKKLTLKVFNCIKNVL